jgi:hypothetical protein
MLEMPLCLPACVDAVVVADCTEQHVLCAASLLQAARVMRCKVLG